MCDLVFYTCFFGSDNNWANLIPKCPSNIYPCYYYTNNLNTFARLEGTNWKGILLDVPIHYDNVQSAMDAKHLKACPHEYKELNSHKYICYFDSKHNVDEKKIEFLIQNQMEIPDGFDVLIPKHPCNFTCIWEEYDMAMGVEKYNAEKEKNKVYIEKQLENLSENVKHHLTTQFILRKNTEICKTMNDTWYKHIQECGIMCQLSFFFIQQIYKDIIFAIEYGECYCYNYCVPL